MIKIRDISFQKLFERSIPQIRSFDIEEIDSINALETFELWYELEYKYNQIKNKKFQGLPERRKNILNMIKNIAIDVNLELADSFEYVFLDWLSHHAITEPLEWAKDRYNELYNEGFTFERILESLFNEYLKYAGDETLQNILEKIFSDIDNYPKLKELMIFGVIDFYQTDLDNLEEEEFQENYEWLLRDFNIENKGDFQKLLNSDEIPEDLIINYAEMFIFEDIEYFCKTLENLVLASSGIYISDILIEFNEKLVFPVWYRKWKAEGIDETRKNIENIYQELKKLNTLPIEKQFMWINIATNATHQSGSIMEYYYEKYEVSKSDLEGLSSESTVDWDKELTEIGVIF